MPVAIVTGASRGLGRQIALTLGKKGYMVCVNYNLSERQAFEVVREIGDNAVTIRTDVSDLRQVEKMIEAVHKKWGRIDAVINNAGITRDGLILKIKHEHLQDVISFNLKSCFNTIRAVSPIMIAAGEGHIVNISSISGLKGRAGQTAYSASKAAILGLTYTAAKEFGQYNIRVNAILPGYMPTDMGIAAMGAMERAMAESILGRLSDTLEVSEFIAYLLTTKGVTGQVFCMDSRIG